MKLTEEQESAMRIFAAIKQNLKQNKNLDIKFIVEITDKKTGERSTYEI